MAEMHLILWQRVAERRLGHPHVRVAVLSTFEHRSYDLADLALTFQPQSDLAILNYIANYIIQNKAVNRDFVSKHVAFASATPTSAMACGPSTNCRRRRRTRPTRGWKPSTLDEFAKFVAKYDVKFASKISGVAPSACSGSRSSMPTSKAKVTSFWTMGVNQHTRGVWVNHMIYNLHLLTGKIAQPGNSPFSLTGQPSACGTAREVGVFSHRLPADMVVMNPKHRATAEEIWKLPSGTIPEKPGFHAVLQSRMLKDGQLNCYWTQTTNNVQAGPNSQEIWPGWRKPENFVVVSDVYPTMSTSGADLILPSAMWVEKEGRSATRSGARSSGTSSSTRRERRARIFGRSWSSPSASRSRRCGPPSSSPRRRNTRASRSSTCYSPTAKSTSSPTRSSIRSTRTTKRSISASTCIRAFSRNTGASATARRTTLRTSIPTTRSAGCAGRSSTAKKPSGASAKETTHT